MIIFNGQPFRVRVTASEMIIVIVGNNNDNNNITSNYNFLHLYFSSPISLIFIIDSN